MSEEGSDKTITLSDYLEHTALTDIGMRREENQDSYGVLESDGYVLFGVADGMGGARGGAIASKLAIETICEEIKKAEQFDIASVKKAIERANSTIYKRAGKDTSLTGMGTTFVGVGFYEDRILLANVGDSRAYRVRGGGIKQITHDHTLVTELVRSGAISSLQANNHPISHMLTRSLGPAHEVQVDCWEYEYGPAAEDCYLLCSDGLYNLVQPSEMLDVILNRSLDEAVEELVRLANDRGGTDNITVMLVQVGEDFPKTVDDFVKDTDESDELPTQELNEEAILLENLIEEGSVSGESPQFKAGVGFDALEELGRRHGQYQTSPGTVENSKGNQYKFLKRLGEPRTRIAAIIGAILSIGILSGILSGSEIASSGMNSSDNSKKVQTASPEQQKSLDALQPEKETTIPVVEETDEEVSIELLSGGLTALEKIEITKKKRSLREVLSYLEGQIAQFEEQEPEVLEERLRKAREETQEIETQHREVLLQVDEAARELARWYGRKRRFDPRDPVDLAGELAQVSTKVKEEKNRFDRSTWHYLQAAEKVRKNPNNTEFKTSVQKLGEERRRILASLVDVIKESIEQGVQRSHARIATLNEEQDTIESQKNQSDSTIELLTVLAGTDEKLKINKKEELEVLHNVELEKYRTLNELLPEEDEIRTLEDPH